VQYTLPDGSLMVLRDCPVNLISPTIWGYLRAYEHHIAGNPWYGGPPAAWPRKYVAALDAISREKQRQAAKQAERDRQRADKQSAAQVPLRRRTRG